MEPFSGWTPAFHDRFGCGSFWWHRTVTPYTSCGRIYSGYYPGTWDTEKQFCLGLYIYHHISTWFPVPKTTKWIKMGKFPKLAYQQYIWSLGFPSKVWTEDFLYLPIVRDAQIQNAVPTVLVAKLKVERMPFFVWKSMDRHWVESFILNVWDDFFQGGYYVYTAPSNSPFSVRKNHLCNKNPRHWFDLWQTWG